MGEGRAAAGMPSRSGAERREGDRPSGRMPGTDQEVGQDALHDEERQDAATDQRALRAGASCLGKEGAEWSGEGTKNERRENDSECVFFSMI